MDFASLGTLNASMLAVIRSALDKQQELCETKGKKSTAKVQLQKEKESNLKPQGDEHKGRQESGRYVPQR